MSTNDDMTELITKVRLMIDRVEIATMIDEYIVTLDTLREMDYEDDWYLRFFTEDVHLTFPIGCPLGVTGLAAFHRAATEKFAATHHLSGNHIIQVDGGIAHARAQVLTTHVHLPSTLTGRGEGASPLFDMGGYYQGRAVRTAQGWRFDQLRFHLVWRTGEGPPS